jgi:hypothetical protein
MVTVANFFSALGFFIIMILLFGGGVYWVSVLFSKYKYHIKYKILKKDFNKGVVEMLMTSIDSEEKETDFFARVIQSGLISISQIKEMKYIYDELKSRMKGGLKHE